MTPAFRLALLAVLIALSLSLFLLEGLVPLPISVPGAKLGLANIVTLFALCTLPHRRDVLLLLLLRTALASLFGGGPAVFLYSVSGALLSLAAMHLLMESGRFSLLGISAAGGFFHNLGQLMVACFLMGTPSLWLYLPILGPCGLLTGYAVGLCGKLLLQKTRFLPE